MDELCAGFQTGFRFDHRNETGWKLLSDEAARSSVFRRHYKFVKSYPIAEIHQNAPKVLRWIYGIRPIGKDYYLYKKR